MKLSRKSEYACLAIVEIASCNCEKYIKLQSIATRWKIPSKFLEQILLRLKHSGYIESRKGSDGGYRMIKNPEQITVAEIIRLFDGPLAPTDSVSMYFYEETPIEQHCLLHRYFKEVRDLISDKLEATTFDQFLNEKA